MKIKIPTKIEGPMFQAGYAWHCADYRKPNKIKRIARFVGLYFGFIP